MRLKLSWSLAIGAALLIPATLRAAGEKGSKTPEPKGPAAAAKGTPAPALPDLPAPEEGRLKGRLPSNYGRIGLADAQKQKIYALQQSYALKIDEAQAKLKELESKRDADIRAVLSDDQRKQLEAIISASAKARVAKRDAKIEAAAAPMPAPAPAKMDPQPAANNNAVAGAKK